MFLLILWSTLISTSVGKYDYVNGLWIIPMPSPSKVCHYPDVPTLGNRVKSSGLIQSSGHGVSSDVM